MTELSPHREIPIKVNAWIDEGVAALVSALNDFEQVETVGSCEGYPHQDSHVLFHVRGGSQGAALFAASLGGMLGDEAPYLLQAEWRAGNSEPLLTLSCPRDSVPNLASAVDAAHRRLSPDGTQGTAPRN